MRLHVFPPSPAPSKSSRCGTIWASNVKSRPMDYFRQDQKRPAFAALNPNQRMPLLEDGDFVLWESNAILFYLASKQPNAGVWPTTTKEQADVLRWLSWEEAHWAEAIGVLLTERVKKPIGLAPGEPDAARVREGERAFRELATVLNAHLEGRRWVAGDNLSIADFALGCWLPASKHGGYAVDDFAEIARWYASLSVLPGWQAALPT